jgi:hypothetical protein
MATSTTRLALRKPDPNPTTGDFVDVAADLSANWDKIDAAIGATICTSGTRPGAPWDGQVIRETDTRRIAIWNNTQAIWQSINGAYICTSGARPSSPFDGLMIRETDTRRFYIWNATQATWDLVNDPLAVIPPNTLFARRTSNSAGKQNNTMADDTALILPVVSGGVYAIDSQIIYTSPAAADFQAGWSGPASSSFDWASWGTAQSVTTFEGLIKVEGRSIAQTAFLGGSDAVSLTCRPGGLFIAGANGSLTFRWAQGTTTASDTIVYSRSWVRGVRVA